ncbi:MAG: response regulator [bacterium]
MIPKFRKITILIVDDHYIMRKTIKDMLKMLGYENFIQAENGHEAFSIIEKRNREGKPVHFVITDWFMPGGSGIELVYQIKNTIDYYMIPVMMITGEMEKNNVARALQHGADNYLLKPFHVEDLDKSIDRLLKKYAYPDKGDKNFFKAEKLFLSEKYREAFSSLKAIYESSPSDILIYKMYVCMKKTGNSEKAEKLILTRKDSKYLPIMRIIKQTYKKEPEKIGTEAYFKILENKIELEWDTEKAVEDTLELADMMMNYKKNIRKSVEVLRTYLRTHGRSGDIKDKLNELHERFPMLLEENQEESTVINIGVKSLNDMRMKMRKLKNKNKLSEHMKRMKELVTFFPEKSQYLFELGVAMLETGEKKQGIKSIISAINSEPGRYNRPQLKKVLVELSRD